MRADYDSEGDTIQIELENVRRVGSGEDVDNGAVIVHVREDRPVMIDVIGARHGFEESLRAAAEQYELDAEALVAGARAALAAPNRQVTFEVGARVAA
jgi:hypothetical protein